MEVTRREAITTWAGTVPALLSLSWSSDLVAAMERSRMGVVIHSYGQRRFSDPLAFVSHCASLGAGGVQTALGIQNEAFAAKLQDLLAQKKMYLEGSVGLPRDKGSVERFSAEMLTAKQCGAKVVRAVLLNGRRYETFDSAEAFRKFAEQARQTLSLVQPIVERHGVRLAIENHKDLRMGELVELIKGIGSPQIGVCVDFGNNVALLEDPLETAEALAPYVFSTHVKDMGVQEYADGFLLSEVPLGTGFLDLGKMIAILRKAHPEIRLNLEMITRDPLKVPCLNRKYWATLDSVSGQQLAEALARVRRHASKAPLPRVSDLSRDDRLKREEENVRQCLRYAEEHLG
jgi:sugar phosphate isomerase/epimerase